MQQQQNTFFSSSLIGIADMSDDGFPWIAECTFVKYGTNCSRRYCRYESIQGLVGKHKDIKINHLLYREPVQIDEVGCNVIVLCH